MATVVVRLSHPYVTWPKAIAEALHIVNAGVLTELIGRVLLSWFLALIFVLLPPIRFLDEIARGKTGDQDRAQLRMQRTKNF